MGGDEHHFGIDCDRRDTLCCTPAFPPGTFGAENLKA